MVLINMQKRLKGIEIAVIGIFLLLVKLVISLVLQTPKTLEEIELYYNVLKLENILQFLGLSLIFSGIVWMIHDFYQKLKLDINEIKENMDTIMKFHDDKEIKESKKMKNK